MARGNNKSQSSTPIKAVLPAPVPNEPAVEDQKDWKRFTAEEYDAFEKESRRKRDSAVDALLKMREDKQTELHLAMRAYVDAGHRMPGNPYKDKKEKLLAVLLALPKEVRDYIERTPKEIFQSGEGYLVRGSNKKSSYMPNETAVASFTTTHDLSTRTHTEKMFGDKSYSLNDIKDYKGVFSFDRISEVIKMANESYQAKANYAEDYYTPFRTFRGKLLQSRLEPGEFFVYGIKWKDGVS